MFASFGRELKEKGKSSYIYVLCGMMMFKVGSHFYQLMCKLKFDVNVQDNSDSCSYPIIYSFPHILLVTPSCSAGLL